MQPSHRSVLRGATAAGALAAVPGSALLWARPADPPPHPVLFDRFTLHRNRRDGFPHQDARPGTATAPVAGRR
ncbi:hypothetical protein [Streptomyces sp. GS7]|uniref:hypothetical protein n=1 Tax=Streptomyces sp. GS7 TaxID=2692234 RepID=UPI001317C740|nr:hypothetical protein [Streptomyces sp. GS7]QHC24494.1 hypothetical protein GR130_27100 [Streptomyces sp. GS7]